MPRRLGGSGRGELSHEAACSSLVGTSTSTTNRSSRSVAQHGERLCFCVSVSRQAMPSAMMKGKKMATSACDRFCCVVALKNEQRRRRGQKAHQKRKRPPWMDQTPAVMAAPTTLPRPRIRSEPKEFCSLFLLPVTGSKLTRGVPAGDRLRSGNGKVRQPTRTGKE